MADTIGTQLAVLYIGGVPNSEIHFHPPLCGWACRQCLIRQVFFIQSVLGEVPLFILLYISSALKSR